MKNILLPKGAPELTVILNSTNCSNGFMCTIGKIANFDFNIKAHNVSRLITLSKECDIFDECNESKQNIENLVNEYYLTKDSQEFIINSTDKFNFYDGIEWKCTASLKVTKFHLIIFIAFNEVSSVHKDALIFPTELEDGKSVDVIEFHERPLMPDIVEGDNFKFWFLFNTIIYDRDEFILKVQDVVIKKTLNLSEFGFTLTGQDFIYTRVIELNFINIQFKSCSNYTLHIEPSKTIKSPNKNAIEFEIDYNLIVLKPIFPHFIPNNDNQFLNSSEFIQVNDGSNGLKIDSNKNLELICESMGRPLPSIKWAKDNILINISDSNYEVKPNSLFIYSTNVVDTGLYQCFVSNKFGNITRGFNITVRSSFGKLDDEFELKLQIALYVGGSGVFIMFGMFLSYQAYQKQKIKPNTQL